MAPFHLVPFLSVHILLSILQCGKCETEYQYYSWSKGLVYHGEGRKLKGALKAHIHIGLYESNTLQEQYAAILFLSVIP